MRQKPIGDETHGDSAGYRMPTPAECREFNIKADRWLAARGLLQPSDYFRYGTINQRSKRMKDEPTLPKEEL